MGNCSKCYQIYQRLVLFLLQLNNSSGIINYKHANIRDEHRPKDDEIINLIILVG